MLVLAIMYRADISRSFLAIVMAVSFLSIGLMPMIARAAPAGACPHSNAACTTVLAGATTPCYCVLGVYNFVGVCTAPGVCTATGVGIMTAGPEGGLVYTPIAEASFAAQGMLVAPSAVGQGLIGSALSGIGSFITANPLLTMGGLMIGSQLLSTLMAPGGGSSGGGGGGYTQTNACMTQYFYTSNTADLSNPCAIYSPDTTLKNTSADVNGSNINDLLNKLQNPTTNVNVNVPTTPSINDLLNNLSSSSCPIQTTPACAAGQIVQDNGLDNRGCRVAYTCVANPSGNVPYTDTPSPSPNTVSEVPISQALTTNVYYDDTGMAPSTAATPLSQKNIPLPANGLRGDIRSFGGGATIYASSRNDNTEVSGFFGSSATAGRLCQSRPWSKNFLSYVIPASFFDSLCTWAGLPTGAPVSSGTSGSEGWGSARRNTSVAPPVATIPYVDEQVAEAKIWARPASVNIGGRTTIFWTSKNVTACTQSSSDGNFSGSSTSGGASTVALTGPVTFTIQCRATNGTMISNSTTVFIGV